MGLPILLLITLIILLIFSESVTVRIYGTKDIRIKLLLCFFSVDFPLKSEDRKEKKKSAIARIIPDLIRRLLPYSDVRVGSARFAEAEIYKSPSAMISGSIALSLLLIHFGNRCGTFYRAEHSNEAIDIFISFTLSALFISLIRSLYYSTKKQIGRRGKNARARTKR